ncbi:uncharacterized protein [Linepithema humile]|uniref:uncharacterized protein isoform X2 n=1 Tax=Linepithema humile TaxID=83485 RepID=UPI00351F088B
MCWLALQINRTTPLLRIDRFSGFGLTVRRLAINEKGKGSNRVRRDWRESDNTICFLSEVLSVLRRESYRQTNDA